MLTWQQTTLVPWREKCIESITYASLVPTGCYSGLKPDQQVMTRRNDWLNSIREWQRKSAYSLSS